VAVRAEERVSVSVFVDPRDRERLNELAREHDRSVSAEIRRAIRAHVEREQDEEDEEA
jgi:predicted transcriptional regulator